MIKRVFSRETFNGYHIISLKGEGEDESGLLLGKKTDEKDESGSYMVDSNDLPTCPHRGEVNTMARPWGEYIIVPSLCQKCIWLYRQPDSEYNCILITMD